MKIFECGHEIKGSIRVPGDILLSHMALMLASVKDGRTLIKNINMNEEVSVTASILAKLGVRIDYSEDTREAAVTGCPEMAFNDPGQVLDCGESVYTFKLLCGLLCGQRFSSVIKCDRLIKRQRIDLLLSQLQGCGANIVSENADNYPPVVIKPSVLKSFELPKSRRDILDDASAAITCIYSGMNVPDGLPFKLKSLLSSFGNDVITIPADFSLAAPFIAISCIKDGSSLTLENVLADKKASAFIEILKEMGADITVSDKISGSALPSFDLFIRQAPLFSKEVSSVNIDELKDNILSLVLIMTAAAGRSVINGLAALSLSEYERLERFCEALRLMKGKTKLSDFSLSVKGGHKMTGYALRTYGDPYLLMALSAAALVSNGSSITDAGPRENSVYPGFFDDIIKLTGSGCFKE